MISVWGVDHGGIVSKAQAARALKLMDKFNARGMTSHATRARDVAIDEGARLGDGYRATLRGVPWERPGARNYAFYNHSNKVLGKEQKAAGLARQGKKSSPPRIKPIPKSWQEKHWPGITNG